MYLFVNLVLRCCQQVAVVSRFVVFIDYDLQCDSILTCNKSDGANALKLSALLVSDSLRMEFGIAITLVATDSP
jgi:hypothetical protein